MAGFLKRSKNRSGGKDIRTFKGLHYTSSKKKISKEKESVYTFPNPGYENGNDDEDESLELTCRGNNDQNKSKHSKKEQLIMIVPLQKEDTLQNLSLKYGRTVAELKTLNNLIKDQDFYGLTHIKVPILKDGTIHELEKNNETVQIVDVHQQYTGLKTVETEEPEEKVTKISIRTEGEEAARFLRDMDRDIDQILAKTENSRKEHLNDVVNMLTAPSIQPLKKEWFRWSECHFSWSSIIIIIIVLALIPAVFIFFSKKLTS